ncbi:MAG TPA: energy-coupling factor ABC transporter permease [Acidimicrobiales bacterium]|nr:energy-coupling factor ABC transporter permease [Acidimicrobiales bacterium]
MHVPDGWVDLPTSAAAGAVALSGTAVAARRAAAALRDRVTTLPAVMAAYLLVGQLLVIPVGFGTSAHLVGTGLAALLVGPAVAIVCVAVVVVVQALVLADGGVTALGLNLVNDGLVPALVAWGVFAACRPLAGRSAPGGTGRRRTAALGGVAASAGALAAAAAATAAFVVGGTDAVPAEVVAASIGGGHVVLAAVEGGLTALVLSTVLRLRPDLVRAVRRRGPAVPALPASPVAGG